MMLAQMVKDDNILNDQLCTNSDNAELERIRSFVMDRASCFGFNENESQKIALAVDEACSNLIKHAYNFNKTKQICVNVEYANKEFIVNILDDGAPFNPLAVPEPDMKKYFNNFKRGGLGVQIMRKVMDRIDYFPSNRKQAKNKLQLKKYLNEPL